MWQMLVRSHLGGLALLAVRVQHLAAVLFGLDRATLNFTAYLIPDRRTESTSQLEPLASRLPG